MNLKQHWPTIREIARRAGSPTFASINADGSPHLTPIGSLILRDDCTGFYIEAFTVRLSQNVARDQRVCVYFGNMGFVAQMRAFFLGRVDRLGGVRLSGTVGPRRDLTADERERFLGSVHHLRWSRGYRLLWGNLNTARDIVFTDARPITLGPLTAHMKFD